MSGNPYNETTGMDNNLDGIFNDRPAGVARNSLHGPGLVNLDVKFGREFRLQKKKEGAILSANISSFNVLNHTNYTNYVGVITSPYFLHATSANAPRRMQANLSLRF
ncbi:MAG: hypothetical protein NVS9B15_14930 [Acidobacteriaceae bacterium]